jgi:excisionase family DNA binding protein
MNKKEAAEFLGCSERAIERYVKAGKISCTYEKGKTRTIAIFDKEELERFKNKDEAIRPAFEIYEPELRQTATVDIQNSAISKINDVGIVEVSEDVATASLHYVNASIPKMAAMIELLLSEKQLKPSEKLVLNIEECYQLTGFSRKMIREAIATNQLKAKKIGKSWKIRKSDLTNFINQLFV